MAEAFFDSRSGFSVQIPRWIDGEDAKAAFTERLFPRRAAFFAAAPAAASIYTDAKIRNGEYVRTYIRMYVCTYVRMLPNKLYQKSLIL